MSPMPANDWDFLSASLHGRRESMAEGARLEGLCRVRGPPELFAAVYPQKEMKNVGQFQRLLVEGMGRELLGCLSGSNGPRRHLAAWLLARLQLENFKVILRGVLSHASTQEVRESLLSLPEGLELAIAPVPEAGSIKELLERMPAGVLFEWLSAAAEDYREADGIFFLEAALDREYFCELLARTGQLRQEDLEAAEPLSRQEAAMFNLMLALRGKFHLGLAPPQLMPLHVPGSGFVRGRFCSMLEAPDPLGMATLALGFALDELPPVPPRETLPEAMSLGVFEALSWRRFARLANRAFRRHPTGFGALVGYIGLRRIEAANLIMISEGLRMGLNADALSARLTPRRQLEPAYV